MANWRYQNAVMSYICFTHLCVQYARCCMICVIFSSTDRSSNAGTNKLCMAQITCHPWPARSELQDFCSFLPKCTSEAGLWQPVRGVMVYLWGCCLGGSWRGSRRRDRHPWCPLGCIASCLVLVVVHMHGGWAACISPTAAERLALGPEHRDTRLLHILG